MDAERGSAGAAGSITVELESSGRRVLRLAGNVDTAVAARFRAEHGREREPVDAVDAGAVTFISSSAVSLIVMFVEASVAAGRRPVLRSASRQMLRVIQLAGIASLLPRPDPPAGPPASGEPRRPARAAERGTRRTDR
ncbi:anti-anti-sigma factor [Blastococcus aggregatus]|uniref:Anti-anti-sigma factor n=1 Tax=Blastococcus aggregatus TaxID=38502 RepID=A0A285V9B5_9ACTN|nr:STAS domain-containing protein [Blastococcus aggregatus]SOC50178.1 anti-anti-sigma factor [Blastococcus aggregatus]